MNFFMKLRNPSAEGFPNQEGAFVWQDPMLNASGYYSEHTHRHGQ